MSSSAAAANLLKPFPRRSCRLKSVEPTSPLLRFSNQKSVLSGGFESLDSTSMRVAAEKRKKNRVMGPTNSMVEQIKMLPLRNPEGEEGARVLERDDYGDGSSELSPLIVDNGWESTLNRLSKWIVAGVFAVVILCRHDGEALWAAMGSVANSVLSMILKRILNQERPNPSVRSEPGMPSSHAQSIFYIAMFTIWSIVEWLGINEITLTVGAFALAIATYLTWLRVSQHLHTLSQVLVGAAFGTTFSILWIWLWNAVVHEAFTSSVWVRIVVASGAAGFCLGFVVYVIRNWLKDDRYGN